jgi:predicted dehydrogenase
VIKVGIIGYGFVTKTFHLPLIAATEGLRVTAIASSREAVVRADQPDLAVYRDPAAMIASSDVDVVVVASPNDTHAGWARTALAGGKHVVVEKPFALGLGEAREVLQLAERSGRLVTVFQNRRWDSDFLTVKAAIDSGRLGRVVHFESHFDRFQSDVRDRWWEKPGPGSGIWYDLAPHLVDQAVHLFGCPDAVEADLCAMRTESAVDDWAHAVLHYPRRRVVLHASVLVAGGSPRFIVHGEQGSLVKMRLDAQEAQLLQGVVPGSPEWGVDQDHPRLWDAAGRQRQEVAERGDQRGFYRCLVAALEGRAPSPVQPHEALAVAAIIEAGIRSSVEGGPMPLNLTIEEKRAWNK